MELGFTQTHSNLVLWGFLLWTDERKTDPFNIF